MTATHSCKLLCRKSGLQEMDGAVDAVDDGLAVGTNRILMGSDQKLQGCSGSKPFTGKNSYVFGYAYN